MFGLWFAGSKWPIWWYRDAYSVHSKNILFCVDFYLGNAFIAAHKPMQYHPLNTRCSYDHCIVSLELDSSIQPMKCHLVCFWLFMQPKWSFASHIQSLRGRSFGGLICVYSPTLDAPSDSEIFDCWVPWYYLNAGTSWKMHSIRRTQDSMTNKPRQHHAKRSRWPYWWLGWYHAAKRKGRLPK